MNTVRRKLKLEESIAAVHLADCVVGDHITGVAEVIPAGEIVYVDRQAPVVGRLRQIEWNGSRYGVFSDDLLKRSDKITTSHQLECESSLSKSESTTGGINPPLTMDRTPSH